MKGRAGSSKRHESVIVCRFKTLGALLLGDGTTQRKRLRTTNVIERLFVQVRRRIRTMCAFTSRDSCERILFSVFCRVNKYWDKHPLKLFTQNS